MKTDTQTSSNENRRAICMFGAASDEIDMIYVSAAAALGRLMPEHGYDLVYGGGKFGLMGVVARSVQIAGGRVVGIIPRRLDEKGYTYREADEIIVTEDMYERKALLGKRAHAFVALPGGIGTLEETFEVLTHRHLGYHTKPIVFLNTKGFYDTLTTMLLEYIRMGFAECDYQEIVCVANEPEQVFAFL